MVSLRDFANLAKNARGDEAREVYTVLRNLLVIVKANLRVERSIRELEARPRDAITSPEGAIISSGDGTISPPPGVPVPPAAELPNPPLHQVIDIGTPNAAEVPQAVRNPKMEAIPAPPPPKPASPRSSNDAVQASISRLLHLPRAEDVDAKPLLPGPFELVISDEELPGGTFLAAQYRQVKNREEVLGILDSFQVLEWGGCAECAKDICGECTSGGIRVKMVFDTVTGKAFKGTAWKNQVAALLRCSVPKLIEVWVNAPEEVNARLSEYLGRPFLVVGNTREWQEELTYSLSALTCLHWGAVAASFAQRAGGE